MARQYSLIVICYSSLLLCTLFTIGSTHPNIKSRARRSHGSGNGIFQAIDNVVNENKIPQSAAAAATHHVQEEKNEPGVIISSTLTHEDISKKLSDLETKFKELSSQHRALQQELTERLSREQKLEPLVTKLERILGSIDDNDDDDDDGAVVDGVRQAGIADDVDIDRRVETLSDFLGNREAELVGYVPDRVTLNRSSSIDELRDELSSGAQKTLDLLGKSLLQLNERTDSLETYFDDITAQITRGGQPTSSAAGAATNNNHANEFHNVSANTIQEKTLMSTRALRTATNNVPAAQPTEVDATRKIAFSVASTRPQLGTSVPQAVEFQDVLENTNGDFVASNNTFVCSVPGWYFFTYSLRTTDQKYLGVILMKNSEILVSMYTDASDRNTMETQSAVVKLAAGDAVWLRLTPSDQYGIYSDKYRYSTFSGFMLFKE